MNLLAVLFVVVRLLSFKFIFDPLEFGLVILLA